VQTLWHSNMSVALTVASEEHQRQDSACISAAACAIAGGGEEGGGGSGGGDRQDKRRERDKRERGDIGLAVAERQGGGTLKRPAIQATA
jgi:hypothetical protein